VGTTQAGTRNLPICPPTNNHVSHYFARKRTQHSFKTQKTAKISTQPLPLTRSRALHGLRHSLRTLKTPRPRKELRNPSPLSLPNLPDSCFASGKTHHGNFHGERKSNRPGAKAPAPGKPPTILGIASSSPHKRPHPGNRANAARHPCHANQTTPPRPKPGQTTTNPPQAGEINYQPATTGANKQPDSPGYRPDITGLQPPKTRPKRAPTTNAATPRIFYCKHNLRRHTPAPKDPYKNPDQAALGDPNHPQHTQLSRSRLFLPRTTPLRSRKPPVLPARPHRSSSKDGSAPPTQNADGS